jgi:uncharacterized membrane protein
MVLIQASGSSGGSTVGGIIGFLIVCAIAIWLFRLVRSHAESSDNPVVQALKSVIRVYGRMMTLGMRSRTEKARDHEQRMKKLRKADQSVRTPAASVSSTAEPEAGASGFDLPEYGSIRPSDED